MLNTNIVFNIRVESCHAAMQKNDIRLLGESSHRDAATTVNVQSYDQVIENGIPEAISLPVG